MSLAVGAAILTGAHQPAGAAPDRLSGVPPLVFWAWERPEDLRGLTQRAGVAFLAATYHLNGEQATTSRRHQPLRVDADTPLVAVVRIETDPTGRGRFTGDGTRALAADIASLREQPGVRAVQIDFDATMSERTFYRDLLTATRAALGEVPLSITALASWCMDDDWLQDLPIDEVVPMLFRLGPVNIPFAAAGVANHWRSTACSTAIGISTDEPVPPLRGRRRVYVFHPRSWSAEAVARARTEVSR
jgi:hypothetical protein